MFDTNNLILGESYVLYMGKKELFDSELFYHYTLLPSFLVDKYFENID